MNRIIRQVAGWKCSPLPKQSQDLVSCLSGYVISCMTPPYPTFMFGTIDNLFYRQHRDVGTLLAPKNYQIPWEFFYLKKERELALGKKFTQMLTKTLRKIWEFFYAKNAEKDNGKITGKRLAYEIFYVLKTIHFFAKKTDNIVAWSFQTNFFVLTKEYEGLTISLFTYFNTILWALEKYFYLPLLRRVL